MFRISNTVFQYRFRSKSSLSFQDAKKLSFVLIFLLLIYRRYIYMSFKTEVDANSTSIVDSSKILILIGLRSGTFCWIFYIRTTL